MCSKPGGVVVVVATVGLRAVQVLPPWHCPQLIAPDGLCAECVVGDVAMWAAGARAGSAARAGMLPHAPMASSQPRMVVT